MIAKLPIRIPGRLAIVPWLVFSAMWILVLLIITQFRMVWLCVGAGALFGFFTDCTVEIFAARSQQRRLRGEFLEQEKYKSHRTNETDAGAAR
jgi:hypothetical protein